MSNATIIDWPACVEITNNNREMAKELINMFAKELPDFRQDISTALANHDIETLNARAHKLRGACRYCKAPTLEKSTQKLEDATKTAKPIDSIKPLVDDVLAKIDQVSEYINTHNFDD